ncbi:amidase [Streptomyces sp. NPDC056909]|uniref:amidase n=1 Tax=Streptomyces sp. NPDC056909 TaxID=3345963 RepID=UPI0036D1AB50
MSETREAHETHETYMGETGMFDKTQTFKLIHCPVEEYPGFDDPRYDRLKARPPEGCEVERYGQYFGLRCRRPGATLLDAVGPVCAEIRAEHGLLMCDLGIEKLWEWWNDGTDGWGGEIVGQLLLMAAERGPRLGYSADDLVRFLRTVAGSGHAEAPPL